MPQTLKYLLIFLSFIFLRSLPAVGQSITFTVNGIPSTNTELFLHGFYGEETYPIDTIEITNNIPNTIELAHVKHGLYAFNITGGDTGTFAMGAGNALQATAAYTNLLQGKIKIAGSPENDALQLLLRYREQFKQKADSIQALDRKMDEFDAQYETKSLNMRIALVATYTWYNGQVGKLQQTYPLTYVAKVIAPVLKVPLPEEGEQAKFDNLISFNHYHFFKNIPLSDEAVITNPYFEEKLKIYISLYTHHGNDELLKKDLMYMIDSLSSNEAVREFIRYAMMKYYVKNGPGKMVDFLAGLNAGVCEASTPFQKNVLLKNIMSVMPGRPAPQLTLKDFDGATRSLTGVLTGKKAGIIVFWASWCGHCRDTIPVLYNWYKEMRDKGLEIYSVSLDDDKYQWHTFTENYTPGWINVSELKGWESESGIIYKIRATPTFIGIDGAGKILLKTNSTTELRKAITPLLIK